MKKSALVKRVILVLFLVVVLSVTLAVSYVDSIAKTAVEVAGSSALGVPVSLDKVKISLVGGSVALDDLNVGNPEGFKTEQLFKLGHCSTKVELKSLMEDTIVVNDVTIENLEITFEQKGMTSNLQELLDSLSSGEAAEPVVEGEEPADEEPAATEGGKKLRLDRFYIAGAKVRVKLLPLPGKQSDLTVTMAPITLENVSSDSDKGQLTGLVVQKVFIAISQAVIKTIAQDIPAAMLQGLQGSVDAAAKTVGAGAEILLKSVSTIGEVGIGAAGAVLEGSGKTIEATGKELEKIGKGTVEQLENAGKGIEKNVKDLGKGVEDLGKGFKGLFDKDKDKKE